MSSNKKIVFFSFSFIAISLVMVYLTYSSSRSLVHEVLAGGLISDTIQNYEFLQKIETELERGDTDKALKIVRAFKKIERERIVHLKGAMETGSFKWYGENEQKIEQARLFLENTPNKPLK